jgi:Tol biopolymer transport system component
MVSRWTTQRFQLQNVIRDMATGKEQELKAARIFENQRVDWTPDPESLLVTSAPLDTPSKLAIVDVESGKVRREVRLSDAMGEYAWPSISPDNAHVFAVKGGNMSNDSRVVRINLQTGEETDICPARPMVWALSPDGSQIACGGFGGSIRVVPVQGGSGRDLVKGGAFSAMAWTPDGKHLIYTTVERGALTSAAYWIVPSAGGQPRRIEMPMNRLGLISIHPDGRRIAITSTVNWTELWVLENLNAATAAKAGARQ